MADDKDIICIILLLFLFYVIFHKNRIEGFQLQPFLGQIKRKWDENPSPFYR
jgi:hypothetical protein